MFWILLILFKLQLNLFSLFPPSLRKKKPSNLSSQLSSSKCLHVFFQSFFPLFCFRRTVSSFLLIWIPSYLISLNLWTCMCLSLPLGFTRLFSLIIFKSVHRNKMIIKLLWDTITFKLSLCLSVHTHTHTHTHKFIYLFTRHSLINLME